MDISAEERRRAFSVWLRTGLWPSSQKAEMIQLKFNPWHDPGNGQFTFANGGRYFARAGSGSYSGGGGGSMGGGGAEGTWPAPDKQGGSSGRAARAGSVAPRRVNAINTTSVSAVDHAAQVGAEPFRRVVRNGYEYQIDADKRTRKVSGALTLNADQPRSRVEQARAGGDDRRATDDGGHYIARRFNGPAEAFNHFAQDANFNRGGYRQLEDQWARAKQSGKRVSIRIVPVFHGRSLRPSTINVWFKIDGLAQSRQFPNERQETKRGGR